MLRDPGRVHLFGVRLEQESDLRTHSLEIPFVTPGKIGIDTGCGVRKQTSAVSCRA